MKKIRIYPEKIPYIFEIDNFKFKIFENSYSGDIYVVGYDLQGNVLGNGAEKMILDFPMWWIYQADKNNNRDSRYPKFNLIPRSIDGQEYKIIKENLETKVILEFEE